MKTGLTKYLISENDRLKSENSCLQNKINELEETIGFLMGCIAGCEDDDCTGNEPDIELEEGFEILLSEVE